LTLQVGFTRLAALDITEFGQARIPVQSIALRNASCFFAKWMDPRVKPAGDELLFPHELAPQSIIFAKKMDARVKPAHDAADRCIATLIAAFWRTMRLR
jgi:hypothetical protein